MMEEESSEMLHGGGVFRDAPHAEEIARCGKQVRLDVAIAGTTEGERVRERQNERVFDVAIGPDLSVERVRERQNERKAE